MSTQQFPVCSACRKYGVILIDGFCESCYTYGTAPTIYRPTIFPNPMLDMRVGKVRYDTRTTSKAYGIHRYQKRSK